MFTSLQLAPFHPSPPPAPTSGAMSQGNPSIISQACDLTIKKAELIYFCCVEHKLYWHLLFTEKAEHSDLKATAQRSYTNFYS